MGHSHARVRCSPPPSKRQSAAGVPLDENMSSLGSTNASAQVAAALKSAASDCPRNGLEVIVHPRFRRQLEEEPAVFCPLDWLPDEVISNVLVHLVSARLHPRTHHHRTPPNPRTLRLPPRTDKNTVFRTNVRSPPTHTQQNDSSISPLNPPSHLSPLPIERPRRRALQPRQPARPTAVRGRRGLEGALRPAL